MQVSDARGVPWTVGAAASGDALFAGMEAYFRFRADALELVNALLADDPDCPAGWVLKGYLLLFARSSAHADAAREAYERAAGLAALDHEQLHVAALKAWLDGETLGAQRAWDAVLTVAPRDLLALRVQHFNAMFLGRPDYLRALAGRTLADWDDGVPGAGFVYGMACMGYEEVGEYARAEDLGRRGTELEPDDLWCVHSVAHVMEAQGRFDEGMDWMVRPAAFWEGRGPMRHHLWWHEALFFYEAGAYDRAIEAYDQRLAPAGPIGYMELSNAASLLLRLEAAGVDVGGRWTDLAAQSRDLIDGRVLTFTDVHALFAFSRAGDTDAFGRLARSIRDYADKEDVLNAEAARRIGVPVVAALEARMAGDATAATEALLAARFDFPRMGGSNAQRDLLDVYLIDCAAAGADSALARRLVNEYLDLRPGSVPMQARLQALANPT